MRMTEDRKISQTVTVTSRGRKKTTTASATRQMVELAATMPNTNAKCEQ